MATLTALYGYTHGAAGTFGDSFATTTIDVSHWISAAEVTSTINQRSTDIPPVNFVFLDACTVASSAALANAFRIVDQTETDRAFIGWTVTAGTMLTEIDWTTNFFTKLDDGLTITAAKADSDTWHPAYDLNHNQIFARIYGDGLFKLHGVYPIQDSLAWYYLE